MDSDFCPLSLFIEIENHASSSLNQIIKMVLLNNIRTFLTKSLQRENVFKANFCCGFRSYSADFLRSPKCQNKGFISPVLKCLPVFTNKIEYANVQRRCAHYNAAVLKDFGEKLEIEERSRPSKLKDTEVRIKVHNCAVNVADTLICSGNYDQKPKLPFVPGYEFSGEVLETGTKVKNLHIGDKIIGLNKDTFSAMAQECLSNEKDLWKIPQDIAFDSAAALVDSYATVLIAARRANLREGDTVLVTASAGGLGLAAVDLAANLFKAKVIGATDSEDKTEVLREKGAFSTVNFSKEGLVKAVMKETDNQGVKVIFDAVGGDTFKDCLQSIAPEGCIVVLGFSSRKIPEILTSQLLPKSCALIGVSLTHYQKMISDTYRTAVEEVIDMYLNEFIDPHIAQTFKLKDVNDAIEHVEERKSAGKVILDVS